VAPAPVRRTAPRDKEASFLAKSLWDNGISA
jgi:hypothetical protein